MEITNELLWERKLFLENREYSCNTIQNYFSDVKIFLKYLKLKNKGNTIGCEEITLKEIENRTSYLKTISTPKTSIYYTVKPTISNSTIQWKRTSIKSFLKFLNLIYDKWLDYKKVELKKCKSDYVESITETEFQIFMNFIGDYEKYRINALRSQLLVNIGYTSWMRLSEMLSLTINDILKWETRITWKGNKTRWVFFTPSTEKLLEDYLMEREKPIPRTWKKENKSDFVFISHNSWYDFGKPVKKNTICEKIKKYSDSLDLWKRITIHSLRHSYATKLLESGFNIREIQELLWHKDIQTTETYCHILKGNLKNKVNSVFT